jgi:2',3'-cyclic-nucleotide 2'-phosphodiesterase (5'-nucleotidase family)
MFRLLRYTLFFIVLNACTPALRVSDTKTSHHELKSLKTDPEADRTISPYKDALQKEMTQVVANCDSALTRDGTEPTVGNFVLLAMEEFITNYDPAIAENCVLIMNRGGLRNNLPAGPVTKGHIFELMPFENEMVIVTITGDKLLEAVRYMLRDKKILSHHLAVKARENVPEELLVHNAPFEANKNYSIVTTDYLAMGGDNCTFFKDPIAYRVTKLKLRDVLMQYCESLTKNKRTIKPVRFGNVRNSK